MGSGELVVRLVERSLLSKDCTGRETYLLTLRANELWDYAAGDWLTIPPRNPDREVDQLLELLGCSGEEIITQFSLRETLLCRRTITRVPPALVEWLRQRGDVPGLAKEKVGPSLFANGHGVASFLRTHGAVLPTWQELVPMLHPLPPRVYSIASGPVGGRKDLRLLIATAIYNGWDNEPRCGVSSSYLTKTLQLENSLSCRLVSSRFHLPENSLADLILIGPGTGLAPFLGFLEQRAWLQSTGQTLGRCWLFFGARNRATDFICKNTLREHLATGILTKLDTAFSRDQGVKIYVQDCIRENGAGLWRWLENGAYLYVCGDARTMAKDVERAIVELVVRHGSVGEDRALEYVQELRSHRRYRQDIY